MKTSKQIIACLLCLLTLSFAACSTTETATDGTQTSMQAQTSSAADETSASSASASVTPTQDDLDALCEMLDGASFFGADYDCKTDNILDYLYCGGLLFELLNFEDSGILREGENLFRNEAYPDAGRISGEDDPLGYFDGQCYISVKADALNAIMENTFNNTVYKIHAISRNDDGSVNYYLHDGMYYFYWEISGIEGVMTRAEKCEAKNGRYLVTINEYAVEPGEDEDAELIVTVAVDAALHETDGKRAWSVYGTQITYAKYAQAYED